MNAKKSLPFLLLIVTAYFFFFVTPFKQDHLYHYFSDQRAYLDIPHFYNVISNVFFLIFALIGVRSYLKNKSSSTLGWLFFFLGVLATSIGSSYYHWNPNDVTLLWDRLPISIAFMSLFSALLCDIYSIKRTTVVLFASLLIGMLGVFHWSYTGDLRLYACVQIIPIIALVYSALFFKLDNFKAAHIMGAVLFYGAAKVFENNDGYFYELLGMSGHPIKHLLAAISVYILISMKKKPSIEI